MNEAQFGIARAGSGHVNVGGGPPAPATQFELLVKALESNVALLESQEAMLRGVLARLEGDNQIGTLRAVAQPCDGVLPRLSQCIDYQRELLSGTADMLMRLERLV